MCACDKENNYLCLECECEVMQFTYNFSYTNSCVWIPKEPYTDTEIDEIVNKHRIISDVYRYRPNEDWFKEELNNID